MKNGDRVLKCTIFALSCGGCIGRWWIPPFGCSTDNHPFRRCRGWSFLFSLFERKTYI